MKSYLQTGLLVVVALLLIVAQAGPSQAGPNVKLIAISRVCALTGCADEIITNLPPSATATGGMVIYSQALHMEDANVAIINISATGDSHFGARLMLACTFDGVACDSTPATVPLSPAGWVTLQRHRDYNLDYTGPGFVGDGFGGAGDLHDNSINYTWCATVPDLDHPDVDLRTVTLKLGAGPGDGTGTGIVFLDSVRVSVYTAKMDKKNLNRCNVVNSPGTPG